MAEVSGIVRDSSGAYAARVVRVYRRDTGAYVGQTLSNASTGAWSVTTADTSEHFALRHDTYTGDLYWNQTVLAMHMDDTGLTDRKGHTVTLSGNATRSSAQSKFGGYAALFDGSGDYLSIPDSADFELGSGDFTIECWVRLANYSASFGGFYSAMLVAKDASGARCFHWRISGTSSSFTGLVWSTAGTELSASYTFSLNTWYHVAVCKSGTSLRFFVDGTQIGTTQTHSTTLADVGTAVTIGAMVYSGFEYTLNGYIDDLRITKGVARYTANFTAPTAAFEEGVSGGTENALIYDRLIPV